MDVVYRQIFYCFLMPHKRKTNRQALFLAEPLAICLIFIFCIFIFLAK